MMVDKRAMFVLKSAIANFVETAFGAIASALVPRYSMLINNRRENHESTDS
jgi:hypothetical protein